MCSHCQRCLTPPTLASSVPATLGFLESPHSEVLRTSRSSLQYLHNRSSIHSDSFWSRERYFEISISSGRHLHFPGHQRQEIREILSAVAVSIHLVDHVLRLRSCQVLSMGPHDSTQFLGGHRAVSTLSQVLCTSRVHDLVKRVLNLPTFSQMPPRMPTPQTKPSQSKLSFRSRNIKLRNQLKQL